MSDANDAAATKQEPGAGGESMHVRLKVLGQLGGEVQFRVKKTTAIGKLKKAYVEKIGGVAAGSVRFLFEGRRLEDNETVESAGLDDEDQIDAAVEQIGGNF